MNMKTATRKRLLVAMLFCFFMGGCGLNPNSDTSSSKPETDFQIDFSYPSEDAKTVDFLNMPIAHFNESFSSGRFVRLSTVNTPYFSEVEVFATTNEWSSFDCVLVQRVENGTAVETFTLSKSRHHFLTAENDMNCELQLLLYSERQTDDLHVSSLSLHFISHMPLVEETLNCSFRYLAPGCRILSCLNVDAGMHLDFLLASTYPTQGDGKVLPTVTFYASYPSFINPPPELNIDMKETDGYGDTYSFAMAGSWDVPDGTETLFCSITEKESRPIYSGQAFVSLSIIPSAIG